MFDLPGAPTARGLALGRPANRKRVYAGDRRDVVEEKPLWGPDAHGVYWTPSRAYYEPEARGGGGETLVVIAPVHPDDLPAGLRL